MIPAWILKLPTLDYSKKGVSQSGENIVIDTIFKNIGTIDKYLVDFGAGDGVTLSNTAHLIKDNWRGLRMDADNGGNEAVMKEFINPANIIELFQKYKVPFNFDFLSIDLDSCDFQLLQAILPTYKPRVICAEYNPYFAPDESKYLQYREDYVWDGTTRYGFSLCAGKRLMALHDYSIIYNHKFLNLFFIRNDVLGEAIEVPVMNEKKLFHAVSKNAVWLDY